MRLRLLFFVPPAALITAIILVSASSFVSALETSLTPGTISGTMPGTMTAIKIQRYESDCDVLYWKIHEISRDATECDADLQCLGSLILCPVAMDERKELEYQRLRSEFEGRCGFPEMPGEDARSEPHGVSATCGSAIDRTPSGTGERASEPGTFLF